MKKVKKLAISVLFVLALTICVACGKSTTNSVTDPKTETEMTDTTKDGVDNDNDGVVDDMGENVKEGAKDLMK